MWGVCRGGEQERSAAVTAQHRVQRGECGSERRANRARHDRDLVGQGERPVHPHLAADGAGEEAAGVRFGALEADDGGRCEGEHDEGHHRSAVVGTHNNSPERQEASRDA